MAENQVLAARRDDKECPPLLPPLPRLCALVSDQAYLQAAAIFQHLRPEKLATQPSLRYEKKTDKPPWEGGGEKDAPREAYQLAFDTLKYQDLLEDVMADSCFHKSQHISSHSLPLAMVMLFDFQDRGFVRRDGASKEDEERQQEVRDLEESLQRCKTKLAASLARYRVKECLRSVSCFLPESVRTKQSRAKHLPLYAWVNTLKTSLDEACAAFRGAGLCEVEKVADLSQLSFCRDPLCPDTLVLTQQLHARLQHSNHPVTHALNTQDRSVSLAVSVVRPLLYENGDVLLAGSFSALTVAHLAVAAAARSGRVLVCGPDHTPALEEEMQELLALMEISNVQVLSKPFRGLHEWDSTIQRLKVIMVLPQCSLSALSDPVATIHSEHGVLELLQDLCHGPVPKSKIHKMAHQQTRLLSQALSFSKVQTVVYCTRSVHPEENEQLVRRVLERIHTPPKLLPFRVSGPVFADDSESGEAADSLFFRLQPSDLTNGCFVARLSRQADPTKVETVQEVLARAAAKGLLAGIVAPTSKTRKKGKRRKKQTGNESGNGQSEEGEEHEDEVEGYSEEDKDKGKQGKRRKKKRGVKGGKGKVSQLAKQASRSGAPPRRQDKERKKKKVSERKGPARSKPRKIPRLTLTLISSPKPSSPLSSITALAHRLSQNGAIKSPQGGHPSDPSAARPPPPPAHNGAAKQVKKPSVKAEKTLKGDSKAARPSIAKEPKVSRGEPSQMGCILPPITRLSRHSLGSSSSGGSSSVSRHPANAGSDSRLGLGHVSPSTSFISLPEL